MTEEPKEKRVEDSPFIKEKIVPRRRNKWMKKLRKSVFVVCMAIVFGVVARAAFLLSGDFLEKWFGTEPEQRKEVDLPRPTAESLQPLATSSPKPTLTPTMEPKKTPTPVPTAVPEGTLTPEPTPEPTVVPTKAPEPTMEPTPEPSIVLSPIPGMTVPTVLPEASLSPTPTVPEETVVDYWQMYATIREVAEQVSKAFVTVEAVEQSVDWFQEIYERRTRTTGLVLGNDGIDLLILVGTEQISGASSIEVYFGEKVIAGRI